MSHSRFPSAIDRSRLAGLALVAATTVACGGGDETCGPEGAPSVGLVATGGDSTLTFGGLVGGLNGDCPAADAPGGVVSLTIAGTGSEGFITLCVARPDLLAKQAQALELDVPGSDAEVRIVDLRGTSNNCKLTIDPAVPATGTVRSTGLCSNGDDPAGFALVVEGSLALTRTCDQVVDSVAVTLRGRVAVAAQ